jgi:uncharacterized lipoprotein
LLHSRIALVALVALSLAGCKTLFKGGSCDKPGGYESAQNLPPLKVPAGLDAPDTRASMPIPELSEPEKPRAAGDPCLDEPPPLNPSKIPSKAPAKPAP